MIICVVCGLHRNFANYSPGHLKLAKMTEEDAAQGLLRIGLEKEENACKLGVMTGATMVAAAFLKTRSQHRWLLSQRRTSVTILRASTAYQFACTVKQRSLGEIV